ncbi:hypothetical protein C8R43DRAFT_182864 [Mycena crocata]|nr:hypothetical protein C8R43DRAFT_182864 [Mycena crocata]
MFSSKPPRKRVPAPSMPPISGSSGLRGDAYQRKDQDVPRSHLESISDASTSNRWSISASTLTGGSVAPSRHSRPTSVPAPRISHPHNTPNPTLFHLELPEDPLRAAIGLQSVLEHPIDHLEDANSENTMAHSLLDFSRRQVGSIKPCKSALSALAISQHVTTNPFTAVAPMVEATGSSFKIEVYFPHAEQPSGQLLDLILPTKATVEDAIALALWTYWEKRWLPELDASKSRDTSVESWIMLVPGKDGVVSRRVAQNKMARFKFDKYAVVRSPRNISERGTDAGRQI